MTTLMATSPMASTRNNPSRRSLPSMTLAPSRLMTTACMAASTVANRAVITLPMR